MNQKGISSIVIILIIVGVLVLVGGGILVWQYGVKNETADWQTYRNEEYGFEIKYPRGWAHQEIAYDDMDIKSWERKSWEDQKIIQEVKFNTKIEFFTVSTFVLNQDIESVVERVKKEYQVSPFGGSIREIEKINNHQTYSSASCDLGCCGRSIYISKNGDMTIAIKGGTFCRGTGSQEEEKFERAENIFNQILSTFKFTK